MSDKVVNDEDFENYINNFFGYGNLDAKLIFVGMEEGGGDEINERIKVYKELTPKKLKSKPIILDVKKFHKKLKGVDYYERFFSNPKGKEIEIQKTWGGIIRTMKAYDDTIEEDELNFQINKLGTLNGNHCMLELFSLPAASVNSEIFYKTYKKHFTNTFFTKVAKEYGINIKNTSSAKKMKTAYKKYIKDNRVKKLSEIIKKPTKDNTTKSVIFYSHSYWKYWYNIMGLDYNAEFNTENISTGNSKSEPVYYYELGKINYYITPHFTKWSVSHEFCRGLGEFIKKRASE